MKKLMIFMSAALLLASCGLYNKYERPEVNATGLIRDAVVDTDTLAVAPQDTASFGNLPWRSVFTDPQLQKLIEQGLERNANLQNAALTVKMYETMLTAAKLAFLPAITLGGSSPMGTIAIDSKFPLENYRIMVDKNKSDEERTIAYKKFKGDVKKHIDDINYKYIIEGVTSNQAMMFIPAEAIFAEINAYHTDLIEYAYKKRVWLVSPTTLISTLTMILMIIQNIERDKYTSIIHEELNKLGILFDKFKERFDKLSRSVVTVNKDIESFNITTDKIKKKFDSISNVDIKQVENHDVEI